MRRDAIFAATTSIARSLAFARLGMTASRSSLPRGQERSSPYCGKKIVTSRRDVLLSGHAQHTLIILILLLIGAFQLGL